MKLLDHIEFFAGADELDRFSRDVAHRERRAAAGVAVEFRQHDAGQFQPLVKGLRHVDGVLTEHGVYDQKDLGRFDGIADLFEFFHQLFVDMQSTRRIEEDHVVAVFLRVFDAGFRDLDGADLVSEREDRDPGRFADDLQLIDRGGTVDVAGDEQGIFPLAFHQFGDLGGVGRFARALKTRHHHHRRGFGRDLEFRGLASHQFDEFFVYDLDDLLRGKQTFEHFASDGSLGHLRDKVAHDFEVYVGFEQGALDLAHPLADVCFGQFSFIAETLERVCQFFG